MGARGLSRKRDWLAPAGALALTVGIAEAVAALEDARAGSGSVADRAIDGLWAVRVGDLVWCAAGLVAIALARPGVRAARIARGAGVAVALLATAIAVAAVASGLGAGNADPSALAVLARLVAGAAAAVLFALLAERVGRAPEAESDQRWRPPAEELPAPDAPAWLERGERLMASDLAFSPRREEAAEALAALRAAAAAGDPEQAQEVYRALERLRR